jgi:hypothetical protein
LKEPESGRWEFRRPLLENPFEFAAMNIKTSFFTLLAFCATSLQGLGLSDRGTTPAKGRSVSTFPIGTYASCAQGAHNPTGNTFFNTSGFQDGSVLALAESGTTVTSSYIDQNGVTQSLSFSTTTGTTATLARRGQVIQGFTSLCVLGPGKETFHQASMTVNAGTLTYNAGTVVLTLTGALQSDAGACGTVSQSGASFWVLCEGRQDGAFPSVDAGPPPVTQLPAGRYSCSTQVETFASIDGLNQYVAGGDSGTLTLTADGSKVTGQYNGDRSLAGTLRFGATTPTTAIAEAGQTLMAPCMVPRGTGLPSQTPEPLPIATGAITLTDSVLFLSFAGTTATGSSCPGAKVVGSLICPR